MLRRLVEVTAVSAHSADWETRGWVNGLSTTQLRPTTQWKTAPKDVWIVKMLSYVLLLP